MEKVKGGRGRRGRRSAAECSPDCACTRRSRDADVSGAGIVWHGQFVAGGVSGSVLISLLVFSYISRADWAHTVSASRLNARAAWRPRFWDGCFAARGMSDSANSLMAKRFSIGESATHQFPTQQQNCAAWRRQKRNGGYAPQGCGGMSPGCLGSFTALCSGWFAVESDLVCYIRTASRLWQR